MHDTYVEELLKKFRKSPNEPSLAKAVIDELNVLIERVTKVNKISRQDLAHECKFLEVVRCIKNQRLHFDEGAGQPLFDKVEQTGFVDDEGYLVCQTLDGETYQLIDVAEVVIIF